MTDSRRLIVTLGLAVIALASQLVGLQAQGGRGLWFGYLLPIACALLVGALNYTGSLVALFVIVVGIGGPALVEAYGYEAPTGDVYINFGMVWWILAPVLLGCSCLGMLVRLAWDARRDRARSSA